jgi:heme-degrading monooxygenase HmoA
MIARIWHGWTARENSDAYEALLKSEILPGIRRVPGFTGAELLRRTSGDETEFVTITHFRTMDDVRQFAGSEYEKAVIPAGARKLLLRFDAAAIHYDQTFTLQT